MNHSSDIFLLSINLNSMSYDFVLQRIFKPGSFLEFFLDINEDVHWT